MTPGLGPVRAGKLVHSGADQLSGSDYSLVDYNRAGVPLLEVVSDPDMGSGAEAVAYAGELRRVMLFMGLTEGVMADGHLRFDVNVSVRMETLPCQPWRAPVAPWVRSALLRRSL